MKPLPEPAIIAFGRQDVGLYSTTEYRQSLWRAFVRGGADFIVIDSLMTGQRFLAACAAHGIDAGWLQHTSTVDECQSEVYEFRLTEAGRKELSR